MFPDDATAERWFERQRWDQTGMYCPLCGSTDKITETPKRKPVPYWCGACRSRFSVRTGTLMARSHIGYQKWAIAIYQHLTNLKGVSSMKLKNDLGVTQKTAWFMLHRIRDAYDYEPSLLDGPVEADETFVGGKGKEQACSQEDSGSHGRRRQGYRGRREGPRDGRGSGTCRERPEPRDATRFHPQAYQGRCQEVHGRERELQGSAEP